MLWVVGLGMMGLNLTWSSLITFWPTLLLEEYGFPVKTSGQMFAMAAMVEGTGSVVVGYFVAKWAHRDFMGPSIAVLGTLVCVGSVGMAWTGKHAVTYRFRSYARSRVFPGPLCLDATL